MNIPTSKFTSKISFNEEGTQILTISQRSQKNNSSIQIANMGKMVGNAIGGIENQVMPKSFTLNKKAKQEDAKEKEK